MKCNQCGKDKELNSKNFAPVKTNKTGFNYKCRDCVGQNAKDKRVRDREAKMTMEEIAEEKLRIVKEKNKLYPFSYWLQTKTGHVKNGKMHAKKISSVKQILKVKYPGCINLEIKATHKTYRDSLSLNW